MASGLLKPTLSLGSSPLARENDEKTDCEPLLRLAMIADGRRVDRSSCRTYEGRLELSLDLFLDGCLDRFSFDEPAECVSFS